MNYSDLRLAPRIPLADRVPLPGPLTLYVEPTNLCNFKCQMCPESFPDYFERAGGRQMMDAGDWERVASQLAALAESVGRPITLNWYMLGEPLANKRTPFFIHDARRMRLADRMILTTNASLLHDGTARELIAARLDYLRVSVYGSTQGEHEAVTGHCFPLWVIHDNVKRLKTIRDLQKAAKPHIYVKFLGTDEAAIQRFRTMFDDCADELGVEAQMNWNDDFLGDEVLGPKPAGDRRVCPSPFYTLVINADLRVSVCCVDWNKRLIVGDLRKQSLLEIWNGEKLQALQLAHLGGRRGDVPGCAQCTYYQTFPDDMDSLSAGEYQRRLYAESNRRAPVDRGA